MTIFEESLSISLAMLATRGTSPTAVRMRLVIRRMGALRYDHRSVCVRQSSLGRTSPKMNSSGIRMAALMKIAPMGEMPMWSSSAVMPKLLA